MFSSLAAAAAIALTAGSTPIVGLPRIAHGVPTTDVPLTALAPAAPEQAQLGSRLGVQILGGTTMAGKAGTPWMRDGLYDKQSDDREMRALKAAEKKDRKWEKVLIGVGVFAAASAVAMIASSGSDESRGPAHRMQLGAAGPRGGGAAFVWKVGFR